MELGVAPWLLALGAAAESSKAKKKSGKKKGAKAPAAPWRAAFGDAVSGSLELLRTLRESLKADAARLEKEPPALPPSRLGGGAAAARENLAASLREAHRASLERALGVVGDKLAAAMDLK